MVNAIYLIFVIFAVIDAYVLVYCIRIINDIERHALEKKSVELGDDDD